MYKKKKKRRKRDLPGVGLVTGRIGFVGLTLPETENTLDKNLSKMNIYTNIVSNNFVLIQTF